MRPSDDAGGNFILLSAANEMALRRVGREFRDDRHSAEGIRAPRLETNNGIRILIVDDDEEMREIVSEHLKQQGYDVVLAATGQSAYDITRIDNDIRLVVSDVQMPGMDGVTLARLLREQTPTLPIVFITGSCAAYDLCEEMVLAKPFTAAALAALVAKGLGRVESGLRAPC